MKKPYEQPTVEKITFDYRDQVVAATSGSQALTEIGSPLCGPGGIIDWMLDYIGSSICT